jgi:hypothetical protein
MGITSRFYTHDTISNSAVEGARVMPHSDGSSGLSTEPLQLQSILLPSRQAALAAVQGRRGVAPPFLVEYLHKSAELPNFAQVREGATPLQTSQDVNRKHPCDSWRSIRGSCSHASTRWLYVRCKRRDCSGCSKVRQWKHASRIANGVRAIGVERCAFMVLTYADPRSADPEFKAEAVKLENSFIRWLRAEQKKLGNDQMEYAKTWEIQPRSKRLHTNLIVGPWLKLDIDRIRERWGARISISWVKDDQAVSKEATKAQSPDGLSTYLTKIEQMVPDDWHRAISFSKRFPKLVPTEPPEREGVIRWESERDLEVGALSAFLHEKALGWWIETEEGSGEFYDGVKDEACSCFAWKPKDIPDEMFCRPNEKLPDLDPHSEIEARQLAELYS